MRKPNPLRELRKKHSKSINDMRALLKLKNESSIRQYENANSCSLDRLFLYADALKDKDVLRDIILVEQHSEK